MASQCTGSAPGLGTIDSAGLSLFRHTTSAAFSKPGCNPYIAQNAHSETFTFGNTQVNRPTEHRANEATARVQHPKKDC